MKKFNESRDDLAPYGLTCELWQTHLTSRPDRHNEIEINFMLDGSLTYLFHSKKIRTEKGKIIIFWALQPHQIVDFDEVSSYYVITIPFNIFSSWNLPSSFTNSLLQGEIQSMDVNDINNAKNKFQTWETDLNKKVEVLKEICILEIQALLKRYIYKNRYNVMKLSDNSEMSVVENMAVYIATNFTKGIRVNDVADHANLHPDYANQIFKKSFGTTISSYLAQQRVLFAQRQLTATNKSITSISYEAGFNSISRFNATFKKMNGTTPRDYRIGNRVV